ncbi:MAG: hypothetical protein KDB97_03010, partial [Flavobacteriales bacterium]|nr:hypothetical protein [Flavobacteriales bacterium]
MRIASTTLLLLLPLLSLAQAGTVDTNFGISGLGLVDAYPNENEYGWTVDVLPDGDLFVIGQRTNTQQLAIRFNGDGGLDNTYGTDGVAPGLSMVVRDGRVLPDGRFLAVGESAGQVCVGRCLPDGSVDQTYGTNGLASVDVSATLDRVEACGLAADGGLYITGYNGALPFDLFVVKLDSNGTPDPTFGTNGIVQSTHAELDQGHDVIEDDQGRVVIAGLTRDGNWYLTLWRFLSDGSPDVTFGTNGEFRALDSTGAGDGVVRQDAAGNYVAAGYLGWPGGGALHVYRATPDGTLEMTFGTNGMQAFDIGSGESPSDMVLLPDGRIYVGGHA